MNGNEWKTLTLYPRGRKDLNRTKFLCRLQLDSSNSKVFFFSNIQILSCLILCILSFICSHITKFAIIWWRCVKCPLFIDLMFKEYPDPSPASSTNGKSPEVSLLKRLPQRCSKQPRLRRRSPRLHLPGPSLTAAWRHLLPGQVDTMRRVWALMTLMISNRNTKENNR